MNYYIDYQRVIYAFKLVCTLKKDLMTLIYATYSLTHTLVLIVKIKFTLFKNVIRRTTSLKPNISTTKRGTGGNSLNINYLT